MARSTGSGGGKSMSATQSGITSGPYLRHLLLSLARRSMTRSKSWGMRMGVLRRVFSTPGRRLSNHAPLSTGCRVLS